MSWMSWKHTNRKTATTGKVKKNGATRAVSSHEVITSFSVIVIY